MSSWVSGRSALLRAALVSAAVGCGGETDSTSSSAGAAGAAGGGQGGSAAGGQGGSPQGGAAGKGGQAGSVPFPCKDPQPILIDGKDSGLDRCADGSTARRSAVTCPSQAPTAQKCPGQPAPEGGCAMDAECTAKPNGYCSAISGLAVFCQCAYGCTMDAECGAGEVCICGTPVGRCMKATCATNTDCGGGACKVSEGDGCGPSPGLACQGAADECGAPVDCQPGNACTLSEGHFACKGMCVAGRPLVVRGQARSAALLARAGWGLRRHGLGVGSETAACDQ